MPSEPTPLLAALEDLCRWLKAESVPGVIIGGVAASLLGRPRMTRDIDALILLAETDWEAFLTAGARFGFRARHRGALDFAKASRVLLVTHEPTSIDADIVFGNLSFEKEAIKRAVQTKVAASQVPLVTAEDLVIMKAVAKRPHDLRDIESVLETNASFDLRRVRRWLKHFSLVLESPEILHDFDALKTKIRKRKSKKPRSRP